MVTVMQADRKSAVLTPSSLACLSQIPSINLTSGCAHDCIYCYARGYSAYPGENKVVVYNNTLDKLKGELLRKRDKPQAVYFSPSSDIFQPVPELLALSHSVLEFLLSNHVGVAFLTKGRIPDRTMNLLLDYTDKVRAQIGIITHDENVRRIFEPNAADIDMRLNQMARMSRGGITVEARIVPILPGITDAPDAINVLFQHIVNAGVKRAAISTLFLRPAITDSLVRHISDTNLLESLFHFYENGKRLSVHAEHSSVTPLPLPRREEIYSRFKQIALDYSIELSVCGCMNPDIGGTCNITGEWRKPLVHKTQRGLFDEEK